MINYLLGFTLCTIPIFLYFDGYNKSLQIAIVYKNMIHNKYKKFRRINSLISTNYTGFFKIFCISLWMIIKVIWMYIIQYLNSTVTQIEFNKYIITYVIKGKTYKMIVKCNRGPSKVLLICDENQKDMCDYINPYLGPEENFHGNLFTPKFWNKKELIFELSDGSEKIFSENQYIIL
jgi:hypothetical protein